MDTNDAAGTGAGRATLTGRLVGGASSTWRKSAPPSRLPATTKRPGRRQQPRRRCSTCPRLAIFLRSPPALSRLSAQPTRSCLTAAASVTATLKGGCWLANSVLLPEPALRLPAPTGVAALPFDREASPSGSNFDVETDRAAASRGRVQAVGARFANVRAHLVHAANGDVRAITAGLTAVVDLIEAEFNAASGGNAPVEAAAAVTGGLTDTEQAARAVLNDLLTENDRLTASLRWIAEQSAAGTAAVELGEKASNTLDAVPSRWSRGPTPHHTGAG